MVVRGLGSGVLEYGALRASLVTQSRMPAMPIDLGSVPGSGRSPGGGRGRPL